jgi:hypothetical protein
MSLVSAGTLVGGIKEYTYRGIQQLPLILTATSFLFTVTTGSISHLNLTLGLSFLMPVYAFLGQKFAGQLFEYVAPLLRESWTRSTSDVCKLVPPEGPPKLVDYTTRSGEGESVPSYWLMNIAFFIGYCISNAVDIYLTEPRSGDPINIERRKYQAAFIISAVVLFSSILLYIRFRYMQGCEGRGLLGIVTSIVFALGASVIGHGMYTFTKNCGAKTSDLFGVLSQILPVSSMASDPVVCAAT